MYSTREISLDVMWKLARNKGKHIEGQHTETLGSARECDWVVGSLSGHYIFEPLFRPILHSFIEHFPLLCHRRFSYDLTTLTLTNRMGL